MRLMDKTISAARGAMRTTTLCACLLLVAGLVLVPMTATAQVPALDLRAAATRLAAGGYVLMMRHARTEAGLGDPPQFRIGECATQRNLSADGREQSRALGATLRDAGIRIARVRSSQWCRCRDTARLAFGDHDEWPALNSFFDDRAAEPQRTREVAQFARTLRAPDNVMLVTHQVNISAALGTFTAPGEIVAGRWREGRLVAEFRFSAEHRPVR